MTDATSRTSDGAATATGDTAGGGRQAKALAGTGTLIRFVLRRDRIRIPVWMLAVAGFLAATAAALPELYPTGAERASRAELMSTPLVMAFRGPGYGLDDYTIGAMVAHELLLFGMLAVALMSVFMVVRHTRAEEESGRTELVRATVVGAYAAPTAVLAVAVVVNLAVGALTALALVGSVDELTASGAWAFGMSMAAVGIAFAAVAALAAQVTEHARGATGYASVALAVAFVLRAVGDTGERALSWLSPIGWGQATRAFVDERWWPLLLPVAFALVLTGVAYALVNRRDVGAGLVRPRPGPPAASELLVRPAGLALRLHRGGLIAWATGLALFGLVFGAIIGEIGDFLAENPQFEEVLGATAGADLLDAFLGTVVLILALLATGYAVTAALRLRSEETEGRAEPLLATALPRVRWAGSHLAVALLGGAAVLLAGALGLGVAAALEQGDAAVLWEVLGAGLAHVPAVWVVVGLAAALFGLLPRTASVAWALLAYAVFAGLLGDVVDLPGWMRGLSPFHHVPALPGGEVTAGPLVLAGLAVALVAVGLTAFRRRGVNVT